LLLSSITTSAFTIGARLGIRRKTEATRQTRLTNEIDANDSAMIVEYGDYS
jgi:hypothetical protein